MEVAAILGVLVAEVSGVEVAIVSGKTITVALVADVSGVLVAIISGDWTAGVLVAKPVDSGVVVADDCSDVEAFCGVGATDDGVPVATAVSLVAELLEEAAVGFVVGCPD